MTNDISEKGLETLAMRHMTGTDGAWMLAPVRGVGRHFLCYSDA